VAAPMRFYNPMCYGTSCSSIISPHGLVDLVQLPPKKKKKTMMNNINESKGGQVDSHHAEGLVDPNFTFLHLFTYFLFDIF
jgi:hypothetical protein